MDDKITIGLHEYMDRLLSNLRLEFDLKLSALREEYKKSEKQVNEPTFRTLTSLIEYFSCYRFLEYNYE